MRQNWKMAIAIMTALLAIGLQQPSDGRPVPDETLGEERSTVTEDTIRGVPSDRIRGGARREGNLFHSFSEFNVETGRGAYFENPTGVRNIFSRVTGRTPSQIDGRLGVIQAGSTEALGNANLFFINPNGIIFGQNASLDVGGSFVGTTANAIGFGNLGFFIATNPEQPSQLLTIDPSAFLFNQINAAPIQAFGTAFSTGVATTLQVPNNHSLLLLGGDISLRGVNLFAPGGRVELGAVARTGTIPLVSEKVLQLVFPNEVERADVLLTQGSGINVISGGGGSIGLNARNIEISRSSGVFSGILPSPNPASSPAGDVDMNATGTLTLSDTGQIGSAVLGIGNSGDINISAQAVNLLNSGGIATFSIGQGNLGNVTITADTISLAGRNENNVASGIFSSVASVAGFTSDGKGGNVRLQARQISLSDGAFVATSNLPVESPAQGTVGNIEVSARDSLEMSGGSVLRTDTSRQANAGDITVDSRGTVTLLGGSRLVSETNGQGSAGSIRVQADNAVLFDGISDGGFHSGISSSINPISASGNIDSRRAGNVTINTGALSIVNDAILFGNVEAGAIGTSSNFNITAHSLNLADGGQIQSILRDANPTSGVAGAQGNTGNVNITLTGDLTMRGRGSSGFPSGIFTQAGAGTIGNAGNVIIHAHAIDLDDTAVVNSTTSSQGNGGLLDLTASTISLSNDAKIVAETFGTGQGGNIQIKADQLIAGSGGQISAGSGRENVPGNFGVGGSVTVDVTGLTELDDQGGMQNRSGIFAETASASRAGDINLTTGQLAIRNGAAIASGSAGSGSLGGDGGNITINASDSIEVTGRRNRSSTITAEAAPISGTSRVSNAGNLTIQTGRLDIRDGATIQTLATVIPLDDESTPVVKVNAGRIVITASGALSIENSTSDRTGIFSDVEPNVTGNAGDITITAGSISLAADATVDSQVNISSQTSGQGNAGNITLHVGDALSLSQQSQIFSQVAGGGQGNAGDIAIDTRSLMLQSGGEIASSIFRAEDGMPGGRAERAGKIQINATDFIDVYGISPTGFSSGIFANTQRGASGIGGNIDITTGRFRVANGGVVTAQTLNASDSGNINIHADSFESIGGGQIVANTLSAGNAGNITLDVGDITLSGFDPNYNNRLIQFPDAPVANTSANSGIFATTEAGSTGNGGKITIGARNLTLTADAQISAATSGTGTAGNLFVQDANSISLDNSSITTAIRPNAILANPASNQGNIDLQTRSLSLANGAEVTARTEGQGDAGNVTIRDANAIHLDRNSTISTVVNQGAIGNGGNININTGILSLYNRSNITSSTLGQGNTGVIDVHANDRTTLQNHSRITSTVNQSATGNSQQINLTTPNLSLRGDSRISAATNGNGRAGDVQVEADRISLSNSNLSTQVRRNAVVPRINNNRSQTPQTDRQGDITLNTGSLNLNNNANITSSTNGRGRAGNITVRNADRVSIDNSTVSSEVRRRGRSRGGDILLNTNNLTLDNNARITASTNGHARAGTITLNADQLEVINGSRLVSSTNRDRSAGTITLNDLDSIILEGSGSGIFANTQRAGRGGRINLQTQILDLNDGAAISTTSQGIGRAGNIQITASDQLQAEGGNITTSSQRLAGGNVRLTGGDISLSQGSNISTDVVNSGEGGNIVVNADAIRLQDDSDIRTSVGEGKGNGGDITVNADSVIAFDDSDIITEAPDRGGNITLNTSAFFGAGYETGAETTGNSDNNGRVDLDASGTVSAGAVQTPNTSFVQNSLADLPANAIDSDRLLANSCIARSESGGTFLITGSGGLPERPGNSSASTYSTGEVRSIPVEAEPQDQSWQPGDAIVEPQGVYRLPDGRLVMSRECQPQVN